MGNLLTYRPGFVWGDTATDRNGQIRDLVIAVTSARKERDSIYSSPNFFNTGWGSVFEILWERPDYEAFKNVFDWISIDEFQSLIMLPGVLGGETPLGADDWRSFDEEMAHGPNSLVGFWVGACPGPLIYDWLSWVQFHANHVKRFTYQERCHNLNYFKRFYKPGLTQNVAELKRRIRRERSVMIDLHDPPINNGVPVHQQQIHIHFGPPNPCALNIDGSWKHPNDKFQMPMRVRELLSEWGFLLPDDHY